MNDEKLCYLHGAKGKRGTRHTQGAFIQLYKREEKRLREGKNDGWKGVIKFSYEISFEFSFDSSLGTRK
jgi:hypothetical protein